MKPAASYFAENYATDFRMHGGNSLCGFPLVTMMRNWRGGKFPHFPEYALCQFALNLHNQAFHAHSRNFHWCWLEWSAPFGDTRMCFSGHGLGSHNPDSIMRFVQAPFDRSWPPVRYEWTDVGDYMEFFFGQYLNAFAATFPEGSFSTSRYLQAVRSNWQCGVSLREANGWSRRNAASLSLPAEQPHRSAEEAYAGYLRMVKRVELAPWPPTGDVPRELLDRRVAELELPIHMMNALSNINVQTIRDLIAQPEANLVRALGKRRLKEIQDKLRELGIMP